MSIFRPELNGLGPLPNLPLKLTNPKHIAPNARDILSQGNNISEMGKKIGADAVLGNGTFADSMLGALDQVSSYQQVASNLQQQAIIDPDSVDVHDITIAQAEANISLNLTRNVLNRIVQGWRDLINTR